MSIWSDRLLPVLVDRVCGRDAIAMERARWVPRARGRVLEVGIGSGLNLSHYDPARVSRVLGVDPSAALLARAETRAAATKLDVTLELARAEALPVEAASFDTVVLTYTLCSVDDPARALAEIRRALAPNGRLLFVEHGLAPDRAAARWQRTLTPAWRLVAGNCHLDRDVRGALAQAGFELLEHASTYSDGPRWLGYTVEGEARPAEPTPHGRA